LLIVVILAIILAAFAFIGYRRGIWREVASLAMLLGTFTVVEESPQPLIRHMDALYTEVMLAVKSGLGDLSAGDLEASVAKLEAIEKPFAGRFEGLAPLAVMFAAAAGGYLVGRLIKSKQSSFRGAVLGMLNGYVLSASFLPWLPELTDGDLPLPFAREGEGLLTAAGREVGEAAASLTSPTVLEWLSLNGGLPLAAILALLFTFAVWRMKPKKA
jgi:hypothetical protein